jgi:hypothetical protein
MWFDMRTKKSPPRPAQSPKSDASFRAKLLPFMVALDADRRVRPPSESRLLLFTTRDTYNLRKWTVGLCGYQEIVRNEEQRRLAELQGNRRGDNLNGPNDHDQ